MKLYTSDLIDEMLKELYRNIKIVHIEDSPERALEELKHRIENWEKDVNLLAHETYDIDLDLETEENNE